jgi:serine/threonine-protein kinase
MRSVAPAMMTPLPRGHGVLFTLCNANCSSSSLYVFDARADSARQLVPNVMQGWYVPTGHLLYVDRVGQLLAARFDLDRLELRGDPIPVLAGVSLLVGVVPNITISGSGTLVMQSGPSVASQGAMSELVWVDRAGTRTPVDTAWSFRLLEISGNNGWAISPDGKRLAIAITTSSGDDIWIKQLPAGALSRLTFDTLAEERPRWTPDGRSVTYINEAGALMQRNADGTGTDVTVLKIPGTLLEGWRSPDGAWIVARTGGQANQRGGRDIIGLQVGADTVPRPLVANPSFDETAPAISPDGRWLAYQSDETGTTEVYVRPFPNTEGGKWQVSVNGGQAPLWAHSGRELFYVDRNRNMIAVPVAGGASPGLGDRHTLYSLGTDLYMGNPEYYTPFDITPDDRRFIMARTVQAATPGRPGTFVMIENWFEELKAKTEAAR